MDNSPKRDFIPFAVPDIGEAEISAVVESLRSGWLTTGPVVASFESAFLKFLGRDDLHAVAVNSATAGLHLALEASGIGPGDEVIVPTWTFTATAEVVRYLGAKPVLVDVDEHTLCLDLDAAESAVTSRTKAVMPVHFAGQVMDADELRAFAEKFSLVVVEDAAHVLPGTHSGRMVGTGDSHASVFSFYATKTITTGEGGMVVTPHAGVAQRMRTMRLHGINRDVFDRYRSTKPSWYYEVIAPGYKYNMTDLAASIGTVQLDRAWAMRNRRAEIAAKYDEAFRDLPLQLPTRPPSDSVHSWHLYVVRISDESSVGRDDFIARMANHKVGCSVHFIPLHFHPYWRDFGEYSAADFPVASSQYSRVVSLPIYPSMTDGEVSSVIAAVKESV